PFDFGLRSATVRSAEAAVVRARADSALTRLDVQATVGAAFLGVVAGGRAGPPGVRAPPDSALTRLDVQATGGAAFLGVVAAERAVSAAQADLARREGVRCCAPCLVGN